MLVGVYSFLDLQSFHHNLQRTDFFFFSKKLLLDKRKREHFWIERSRIGQNGCESTRENRGNHAGKKGRKTCVRHVFVKSVVRSKQKGQGNALNYFWD